MYKKILVAYTSKYGTTQTYAQWIAAALDADLRPAQAATPDLLRQYDVVLYGGGLYAGGIAGVQLVTKHPCKNLVVFTVGLANPETTDYSTLIAKNFTAELTASTKFFHLRGGIDYKKLSFVHKIMMAMMKSMTQRKPAEQQDHEDREFLATYNTKVDFTDECTISPIIAYVNSLQAFNE